MNDLPKGFIKAKSLARCRDDMLIIAVSLDIPINRDKEIEKDTKPYGLDQDWRLEYYFLC